MSDTRRIRANSSWMVVEQVFRQAINLGFSIWIARKYGPAGMGTLSFALSLTALFGVIATLGLNRILVREFADPMQRESADTLLGVAITLRLMTGLVVATAVVSVGFVAAPEHVTLIALLSIGYFVTPFEVIDLYFQSQLRSSIVAKARMVAFVASSSVKAFLLVRQSSLWLIGCAFVCDWAFASGALWIVFTRRGGVLRLGLDAGRLARKLLSESWPEIIAGFSALSFMRIDQVMLQSMRGAADVGIMAVSSRLTEAWYFIPAAIVSSTYPVIVALGRVDPHAAERRQIGLYRQLIALSIAAGLAVTLLADTVIQLLYGKEFAAAARVLVIQGWCGVFMSFGIASGTWLMANRLVRYNLYRTASGALTNVALNVMLIPRYGAVGAAWATLAAFAVAYFLFDFLAPPMRDIGRQKLRALELW